MKKNNRAKNLRLIFSVFAVGVFAFGNFASAQTKRPKKQRATPNVRQPPDKIEYAPDADLLKEMRAQIAIVESKKDWKQFDGKHPIRNKTGDRSAYVAQFGTGDDADASIDVIVVYEKTKDKFYEIRGFDFLRPFDRLQWIDDDTLDFEQWVSPHNGGRYRVNFRTGKVSAAGYVRSN